LKSRRSLQGENISKSNEKRLAVEAGSVFGWHKYIGDEGDMIGMTTFGESAPAEDLFKEFGFTVENVVARAKALISKGS
jgi:transketolase